MVFFGNATHLTCNKNHSRRNKRRHLERLVEATINISPTGKRFEIGEAEKETIEKSIGRAIDFSSLEEFKTLKAELDAKVNKYQNELLIASHIENVNIRG
jgi:hypothetical protein